MVAAAIVGSAVVGGVASSASSRSQANAARDAGSAQQAAADAAARESARQYDQSRADWSPYRETGYQALNALGALYGFNPGAAGSQTLPAQPMTLEQWSSQNPIAPQRPTPWLSRSVPRADPGQVNDGYNRYLSEFNRANQASQPSQSPSSSSTPSMAGFFTSPDYEFRRDEGMRGIGNSFAARGGAASGNALRALSEYNSNLASGEFGNYTSRLFGLANLGASGTSGTVAAGNQNSSNLINILGNNGAAQGNALLAQGNARASGINNIGNSINQGIGNYLMYRGMQ